MGNRFTVWTDLRVRGTGLSKEVNSAKRAFGGLSKSISNTANIAKGILIGGGLYAGIAQLGQGVRNVTDEFISLDHSLTSAGARFGDAFGRGTKGFKDLSAAARETGSATEHTAAAAGDGLSFMAMAGFSAAESMALLPDIANLATAANLDFARSSDIASDALGAFGKNTGTAEEKAAAFKSIMDQAAKSTNTANMDLEMWFESIREGAPSFVAAGQEMSTLNTMIAEMANNGKKGATSGFMLRNVMNRLAGPVGKGKKALRAMNIEVADADGNFRDVFDIMQDMEVELGKMGEVGRTKAIKEIFGERAVAGMNILFAKGAAGLKDMRREIEDSGDASEKLADKMRGSVQNRIAKIKSAATELGLKFFDAFGPKIEGGIASITKWLDDANDNSEGWLGTVKYLADALSDTVGYIYDNREMVEGLLKAYLGFKAANIATDVIGGLTNGFMSLTQEIGGSTAATKGLQGALGKVNAAAVGLSIGLAIGNAIWQVLDAQVQKTQRKRIEKENKLIKKEVGIGGRGTSDLYSDINELERRRQKLLGNKANASELDDMYDANAKIEAMRIEGILRKLRAEASKRANVAAGGGTGMFGSLEGRGMTEFIPGMAMGAQSAPIVQPSFDVFVNNTIGADGNTTSSVEIKPTSGPTPNNAGALP
jgi:TP901 family phage tail tape measure protein